MKKTAIINSKSRVAIIAALCLAALMVFGSMPVSAFQLNAGGTTYAPGDSYPTTLQNPGFEDASLPAYAAHYSKTANNIIPDTYVPGWVSPPNDNDNDLEVWPNGFVPGLPGRIKFSAYDGSWYGEIVANDGDTGIYQDLSTTPGGLYQWSFYHLGRGSSTATNTYDYAEMLLGGQSLDGPTAAKTSAKVASPYAQPAYSLEYNGGNTTAVTASASGLTSDLLLLRAKDVNKGTAANPYVVKPSDWTYSMGYYTVPAGQTVTRYMLYSYSTAAGNQTGAMGNMIDDMGWIPIALPNAQTIEENGTPGPYDSYLDSDYTATPENPPDVSKPGTYDVVMDIIGGPNAPDGTEGQVIGTITSKLTVLPSATVQYVDQDGNVLSSFGSVSQVEGEPSYAVNSMFPGDIPADGTFTYTAPDGTVYTFDNNVTGDAPSGDWNPDADVLVKYEFAKAPVSVTVQYVDVNGAMVAPDQTDSAAAQSGDSYNTATAALKPATITSGADKYDYVGMYTGSDPESGKAYTDKNIIYEYQLRQPPDLSAANVQYVDRDGNVLTALGPVLQTAGETAYDVNDLFPGAIPADDTFIYTAPDGTVWTFDGTVKGDGPAGDWASGTDITVQYEFAKAPVAVTVQYVDENGATIAPDQKDSEAIQSGDSYNTATAALKPATITSGSSGTDTYSYVGVYTGSDPESGIAYTDKNIIYQYRLVQPPAAPANAAVQYIDGNGNVLTDLGTVQQPAGDTSYDVSNLFPGEIPSDTSYTYTAPDGTVWVYDGSVKGDDPAGDWAPGTDITVQYEFSKAPVAVTVQYIDMGGNQIQASAADSEATQSGDSYDTATAALKPATITSGGNEYDYVGVYAGSDPESGVAYTDKNIIYQYQLQPPVPSPNATVQYVDQSGNVLNTFGPVQQPDGETSYDVNALFPGVVPPDTTFAYTAPDGTVWVYDGTASGNDPTGDWSPDTDVLVRYEFAKAPVAVTVQYVDANGAALAPDQTDGEATQSGDPYNTSVSLRPATITSGSSGTDTYSYVGVYTGSDPEIGKAYTDKNIIYEYQLEQPLTLSKATVEYVDKSGDLLAAFDPVRQPVGDTSYDVNALFPGAVPPDTTFTYTAPDGTVWVYDGIQAGDSPTGTWNPGTDVQVRYEFSKAPAAVTVHYVDMNGDEIQGDAIDDEVSHSGDTYDTAVSFKPDTITSDGSTYEYVSLFLSSDPEAGTAYTDENVIYEYQLSQAPPAPLAPGADSLTVSFIDGSGNPIAADIVQAFNTGDSYNYKLPAAGGALVGSDGKTYEFTGLSGNSDPASGVMNGDAHVVLVYKVVDTASAASTTTAPAQTNAAPAVNNAAPPKTFDGFPLDLVFIGLVAPLSLVLAILIWMRRKLAKQGTN